MLIIGIDPDSSKNGVAVYEDGKLIDLLSLDTIELFNFLLEQKKSHEIQLHVEDVSKTKANFTAKKAKTLPAKLKIARDLGNCEHAQKDIETIAKHLDIEVIKHTISSKWKKGAEAKQFEKITGWTGRSNEDTRSGAYFGYVGVLRTGRSS